VLTVPDCNKLEAEVTPERGAIFERGEASGSGSVHSRDARLVEESTRPTGTGEWRNSKAQLSHGSARACQSAINNSDGFSCQSRESRLHMTVREPSSRAAGTTPDLRHPKRRPITTLAAHRCTRMRH